MFSILATVSPVVMETRTVVKDGGQEFEGDETVNKNQVYVIRLELKHKENTPLPPPPAGRSIVTR